MAQTAERMESVERLASPVEGRIINLKPGQIGTYVVTVAVDAMGHGRFEWGLTVVADSISEAQEAARKSLLSLGMGLALAFRRPGSLP
jgi:hypothetical protein